MSTAAPAVAASVYECSGKNGQTTYTQNPSGNHCRPANLGAPSIYSAAPVPAIRTQKHLQQRPQPAAIKAMCSARRKNWRRHKRIWRPADKCAMAMSAIMPAISSAFRGWSKPCKTHVRNWSKPKAGK